MDVGSHLLSDLGLREPDALDGLQGRGHRPELLQSGDPVDPNCIIDLAGVGHRRAKPGQHLVQPRHQGVHRDRRNVHKLMR